MVSRAITSTASLSTSTSGQRRQNQRRDQNGGPGSAGWYDDWAPPGHPCRSAKDLRRITLEIGLVGRAGLDINDPVRRYRLRSMAGDFSGLQLAAYMFVGLLQIAPDTYPGIGFTAEYRLAAAMRDAQRG